MTPVGGRLRVAAMLAALCVGLLASGAQAAPLGLFGTACITAPWATFGSVAEWDDFAAAAQCSRATGKRWVVQLYGPDAATDLRAHVTAVHQQAVAAGLAPYVLAVTYREEWFESLRHGLLRTHPVFGVYEPDSLAGIAAIRDHLTAAHAAIHERWPGVPVGWITTFVNPSRAYGDALFAPLPGGVDVLVLDPYATATQTFDDWPGLVFAHAVNVTTLPIAVVPQWFAAPGTTFAPRPDLTAGYAQWLRHPRVVAGWGFAWAGGAGLLGLQDLPALRASIETAFRAAALIP